MSNKPKSTKQNTQRQIIRKHLLSGGTITTIDAFSKYGITRLPAIIHVLRQKEKIPIETIRIQGDGHKWWGLNRIPPAKLKEVRRAASDK